MFGKTTAHRGPAGRRRILTTVGAFALTAAAITSTAAAPAQAATTQSQIILSFAQTFGMNTTGAGDVNVTSNSPVFNLIPKGGQLTIDNITGFPFLLQDASDPSLCVADLNAPSTQPDGADAYLDSCTAFGTIFLTNDNNGAGDRLFSKYWLQRNQQAVLAVWSPSEQAPVTMLPFSSFGQGSWFARWSFPE